MIGGKIMSSVVLASASPARARLLSQAGVKVVVRPAAIDEAALKRQGQAAGRTFDDIARQLATTKAMAVAAGQPPATCVIGADQALICDGAWFDKARDLDEAAAVLARLQGRCHRLISAVCVTRAGRPAFSHVGEARLTMRRLTPGDIARYLALAGPSVLGAVGCYHLEGVGVRLFEAIEGDFFTILGLPLLPLLRYLREEGVIDGDDRPDTPPRRMANDPC